MHTLNYLVFAFIFVCPEQALMVEMFPQVLPLKGSVVLRCVYCIHFKCSSLSITKVLKVNTLLKIYQFRRENLHPTNNHISTPQRCIIVQQLFLTLHCPITNSLCFFFFLILYIFSPSKPHRDACALPLLRFSTASIHGDPWFYFAYVYRTAESARGVG